jgi:hypothetical protein
MPARQPPRAPGFHRKNRLFALLKPSYRTVSRVGEDFLDPRRLTGLIEDRFRPRFMLRPPRRPASLMVTERPFRAATGSTGLPGERGQAKIEHVVESWLRLLLIFRH